MSAKYKCQAPNICTPNQILWQRFRIVMCVYVRKLCHCFQADGRFFFLFTSSLSAGGTHTLCLQIVWLDCFLFDTLEGRFIAFYFLALSTSHSVCSCFLLLTLLLLSLSLFRAPTFPFFWSFSLLRVSLSPVLYLALAQPTAFSLVLSCFLSFICYSHADFPQPSHSLPSMEPRPRVPM